MMLNVVGKAPTCADGNYVEGHIFAIVLLAFGTGVAHAELPACTGTSLSAQENTQSNCVIGSSAGKVVETDSVLLAPTVISTPVTQTIDDAQTTVTAELNGRVVLQESFAGALSAAAGVAAVAQADSILKADAATYSNPILGSTSRVLQSSTVADVATSPTLSLSNLAGCSISSSVTNGTCAGVSYHNTVTQAVTYGPTALNIGLGASDVFNVESGQEDINIFNSLGYTVTQNALTTNTELVTQNFVIDATSSTVSAPEIDVASAASALMLLVGSLLVMRGKRSSLAGGD